MILDVFQPHHLSILKKESIRNWNKGRSKPPNVVLEKASIGGVSVNIQVPIAMTERLIKEILHVYGIHNGRSNNKRTRSN